MTWRLSDREIELLSKHTVPPLYGKSPAMTALPELDFDYIIWTVNGVRTIRTATGEAISDDEFIRRLKETPGRVMSGGQSNFAK